VSAVPAAVRAVLEEHRAALEQRVATVEQAVTSMVSAGGLDEDLRARAERDAHKLAGSLGMFGAPRGSELAADLERSLGVAGGPAAAELPRLAELVLDLQNQLLELLDDTAEGEPPEGAGSSPTGRPTVLFVTPDPELGDRLSVEATGRDIPTRSAVTCAGARRLTAEEAPGAVVLDVTFAEAGGESLDFLEELTGRDPPVPVLVLTASEALVDRVEVARRGGGAFMQRTQPAIEVIEAVSDLLNRVAPTDLKVLAVDDDPAILEAISALLGPHGLDVRTSAEPYGFWEALTTTGPDLLLLDLDMPGLNGIDLCRAARADRRFAQLPIMFLTSYSDPARVQEIFEAGADDYVGKPIIGQELLTRVRNRLERVRGQRELTEKDHLTGTASRRRSGGTLEALLALADGRRQPVALALIDLDDFGRFNDLHGEAAGDAALRGLGELAAETFRGEDVVGRWGDDELLVGAYGMTGDDGVQRVAEMLEAFRERRYVNAEGGAERISFSAGVAEYPRDGGDVRALYRSANKALALSKEQGGDRVLPVQAAADVDGSRPDVVVVDDDDVLASLLIDSLQTRGYRTQRFADGQLAADALSGASPAVAPSLILLDVDLPGMDGLAVLRRLAKDGVLGRTRVIMLTAHSGESEVIEALELGACDHVSKPFSVPILIQRIRRALRR
jgi:diguanylate cyclase (GGDEF)-like protein